MRLRFPYNHSISSYSVSTPAILFLVTDSFAGANIIPNTAANAAPKTTPANIFPEVMVSLFHTVELFMDNTVHASQHSPAPYLLRPPGSLSNPAGHIISLGFYCPCNDADRVRTRQYVGSESHRIQTGKLSAKENDL